MQLLAMVTQPVKAVLMVFPISPQMETSRKTDDEKMRKEGLSPNLNQHIVFIEQKVCFFKGLSLSGADIGWDG